MESRLMMSAGSPAAPVLNITSSGFSMSIDGGAVQTTGASFGLSDPLPVTPVLAGGSLIYTYPAWTLNLTPTQDSSGIHFAMRFTNTGSTAANVPDFTLCGLTGNLQYEWASNQAAPLVLDQTLADGSHLALTVDDINYPIVAEFEQATNPADGTMNIYFHPGGGQYTRYDLGLTPLSVAPGDSTTVHCSLRVGASTAAVSAATDAAWAATFPYALNWTDRRQMLRGDMFQYPATPANPQGCQCGFDINNPANFQAFETFVMNYAANAIATAKACNAGTWIEWDLEGQEQGFDYKGNPSLIEALNPGWAQTDAAGVPLITRFFQAFQKAGINVGVCVRPQTLAIDSNGNLYQDTSVSGAASVANQVDYCEKTWGIKVFYLDSPQQYQTAEYRTMVLSRPGTLLIPEDVPESWLQFSAPMVWWSGNNFNWQTVPRSIYGNQGWGVYFHQDLTDPTMAADFEADAEQGSSVLTDWGWMGPDMPQVQAAVTLLATAASHKPVTPIVTVIDAGGIADGTPYTATATATLFGIDLPISSLTYYEGATAGGAPLAGAPSQAGTYTVVAMVDATGAYAGAASQTTFTITAAPAPTVISSLSSPTPLTATSLASPPPVRVISASTPSRAAKKPRVAVVKKRPAARAASQPVANTVMHWLDLYEQRLTPAARRRFQLSYEKASTSRKRQMLAYFLPQRGVFAAAA